MLQSKNNLTVLDRIRLIFFCILPASLFFSYYPIFSLGSGDTMNYEFSIPLLVLVLFVFFSFPDICYFLSQKSLYSSRKSLFVMILLFLIPVYPTISILWSENVLRGLLTAGLIWCIVLSIFSILELYLSGKCCKKYNKTSYLNIAIDLLTVMTMVVCLFCWAQCILDCVGVDRETTLLCTGCVSSMFGFPHPSGFAIEPQFMGNLLLLPSLAYVYLIIYERKLFKKRANRIIFYIFALSCIFTLFLTFSRGAIYSFIIACILLLAIVSIKKVKVLKSALLVCVCFVLSLFSQGLMSEFSYTDSTFISGISSSISQLSLGLIDIPVSRSEHSPVSHQETASETTASAPEFDGYVENSTGERMLLNYTAFNAWNEDYYTFAFGHGLGSSGIVLNRLNPDKIDQKEIVQNEPLAILLELGITFAIIVSILLVLFIKKYAKTPYFPLILSCVVAYLVSLLFFSGLPNALHIYFFTSFLILFLRKNEFIIDEISNHHRR